MKNFKKITSLVLAFLMVFSVFGVCVYAEDDFVDDYERPGYVFIPEVGYVPEDSYTSKFDRETPVVLLHGIGQNDTYILDDEGNRLTDKDGGYVTGWPLEIDVLALIKEIFPHVILSIFTRRDAGLKESMKKGAYELLYAVHKDSEGNYENNVEVPCYKCPMSELPEDVKSMYYRRIPVQQSADIVGEDNLYYFGYDSIGDIETSTKQLHEYITQVVLPQTGAKKVNICPISLGGTLAVSYLEMYPEDYQYIKNIVNVVPAINGSDIVGDLLTGNLSTFDSNALYGDLLVKLLGNNYTTYLLALVLRIIPTKVLKQAIVGLADGAVEALARNSTQLWALCPSEYYPEAREKWIADEEHSVIARKVDNFMTARDNFEENVRALEAEGGKVYDIVCHGLDIFPLAADYKTTNSDGIIQCESTSMGATFAPLNERFPKEYEPVGTYCSAPEHNHVSPDGTVDATTGLLPERTWFVKGQAHESLANSDYILLLATLLMCDDNMDNVRSWPEAFPQFLDINEDFNSGRIDDYVLAWQLERWDIAEEDDEKIEEIVLRAEKMRDEYCEDKEAWAAIEQELKIACEEAGIDISENCPTFEDILTQALKKLNDTAIDVLG